MMHHLIQPLIQVTAVAAALITWAFVVRRLERK
jgi:hypothetical protein